MHISASAEMRGNFIHITPVPLNINQSNFCDYCVRLTAATHYIYSFDAACDFMTTCSCDKCTQGWREIADQENKQVV